MPALPKFGVDVCLRAGRRWHMTVSYPCIVCFEAMTLESLDAPNDTDLLLIFVCGSCGQRVTLLTTISELKREMPNAFQSDAS